MDMEIRRSGAQPSRKGPAEWFTGTVRLDPLFAAPEPARVSGGMVTFEPGARTAWHTHPLGQSLLIISGLGWVQRDGGPISGQRHDARRNSGIPQRQERRLAREGQRRARPQIIDGRICRSKESAMKGPVLCGSRDIRFEERDVPKIIHPTDAIIRIVAGKVFHLTLPREQVGEGHHAMEERRAIKTLLRP